MYGRYGHTMRGAFPLVGNALYHTVGDRAEAVRQLDRDFEALYGELVRKLGLVLDLGDGSTRLASQTELDAFQHADPRLIGQYVWWQTVGKPVFDAWEAFKRAQIAPGEDFALKWASLGERWETSWSEYDQWFDRLKRLREDARKVGFALASPAPEELPTTIPEDVAHFVKKAGQKAAEKAGEGWDLIKFAIYGGLVLGGVIALSSVVSNLRAGKDPAENYLRLAERGARTAAKAAV